MESEIYKIVKLNSKLACRSRLPASSAICCCRCASNRNVCNCFLIWPPIRSSNAPKARSIPMASRVRIAMPSTHSLKRSRRWACSNSWASRSRRASAAERRPDFSRSCSIKRAFLWIFKSGKIPMFYLALSNCISNRISANSSRLLASIFFEPMASIGVSRPLLGPRLSATLRQLFVRP